MPKTVRARPAQDEQEARSVQKLAASRHGPADWIQHARMVVRSWEGARVEMIAAELHCDTQRVRRRLHRFDSEGVEGLGDRPRPGRPRRLTSADDSALIALVHPAPPGQLVTQRDGTMVARDEEREAQWSLSALAQAAKDAGIPIKRSQIRRMRLEGRGALAHHPQLGRATLAATSPQKNGGRQPLCDASRGFDDPVYR
jgi:hypothetical protein